LTYLVHGRGLVVVFELLLDVVDEGGEDFGFDPLQELAVRV
jgi:hypothetical protein